MVSATCWQFVGNRLREVQLAVEVEQVVVVAQVAGNRTTLHLERRSGSPVLWPR